MKTLLQLIFIVFVVAITTAFTSTMVRAQGDNTSIKIPPGSRILAFGEEKANPAVGTNPDWYHNLEQGVLIADVTGEKGGLYDVLQFHDGGLVIVGNAKTAFGPLPVADYTQPMLIGVTPRGRIDGSFGNSGIVFEDLAEGDKLGANGTFTKGLVQKGGKFVVFGVFNELIRNELVSSMLFIRYNRDGSLDRSWAGTVKSTDEDGYLSKDIAQDDQGNFYVLFGSNSFTAHRFRIKKYDENGRLVTSWGNGGQVTHFTEDSATIYTQIAIDKQGRMVLLYGLSARPETRLARVTAAGRMDDSFGNGGFVSQKFLAQDFMYCMAIDKQNRIVTGGYFQDTNHVNSFGVKRYKENGKPDLSFNNGLGYNMWDLGGAEGDFYLIDIKLQGGDEGKIVGIGHFQNNTNSPITVVLNWVCRYKTDGTVDTAFGDSGKVTTKITYHSRLFCDALKGSISDDGSTLVVGANGIVSFDNDRIKCIAPVLTKYYLKGEKIELPPSDVAAVKSDAVIKESPGQSMVASVHPNPTKNSATIAFSLDKSTNVSVHIVNMNGAAVVNVFNGTLNKGSQVMQADMSKLPPGMYNVVIQTGLSTKTIKLMKE